MANHNSGSLADGEYEIYGQRMAGATGAERGNNDFRISDMGATDGDAAYTAYRPQVAYLVSADTYLGVWPGG